MNKIDSTSVFVCFALLGAAGALGCGGDDDDASMGEMVASSENAALLIYPDPYAPMMAGAANPITVPASATAFAFDVDGKLRIELNVVDFPATRSFGSHLHRLPCDDAMKAGGHYQNMPFPTGGSAQDPAFANATNEAWLDFTTDAQGKATRELTVDWLPRAGEAKGIIIHDMASGVGGVSGAKLACLPVTGF